MDSPISDFASVTVNVGDLRLHTRGILKSRVIDTDASIVLVDWTLRRMWRLEAMEVGSSNRVACDGDII